MPPEYPLRIITPEYMLFTGQITSLRAPGTEGSFGVLAHHAPLLAALDIGPLAFTEKDQRQWLATSGGFVEVTRDGVTVLAETAEFSGEIDVARAEAALERARERLRDRRSCDVARAEAALGRALNRLQVAGGG